MWTEFLKIKPTMSSTDLNAMVSSLSTRFAGVARKFGSGLKNVLLGGGILGTATAILNKMLNPLKDVQEILQGFLDKSDDLVTNSKQFGTTPGKLARFQSIGTAAGLDSQTLNTMLSKFQVARAEARTERDDSSIQPEDKKQFNLLKNFLDESDTAEALFQFLQAIKEQDTDTQVLAQKQVFGEKFILKQSEFLNADLKKIAQDLSGVSIESLDSTALRGDDIGDRANLLKAIREEKAFLKEGNVIKPSVVDTLDAAATRKDERDIKRLTEIEALIKGQEAIDQISFSVEQVLGVLNGYLPSLLTSTQKLDTGLEGVRQDLSGLGGWLSKISGSRLMRGVGEFFGAGIERVK